MAASIKLTNRFQDSFRYKETLKSLYNSNNINELYFIRVELDKPYIECPLIIRNNVEQILSQSYIYPTKYPCPKDIIVQLYVNNDLGSIKTADSILANFFNNGANTKLIKIKKGTDIYYGNRGIILDCNFNPIMLIYVTIKWEENLKKWIYGQPIIKISPDVFINQQDFMNKAIIKKIIPLSLGELYIPNTTVMFKSTLNVSCKIQIEDIQDLILKPIKPCPETYSDEVLNRLLLDNIKDVEISLNESERLF
jgi:hypothetical protein